MTEPSVATGDALADIAYLSRSENRVRVLETLATGPHARRELGEVTGVSRTTLGRILTELQERGWAERTTDGDYAATSVGEHVVASFLPLVDAMRTLRDLDEMAAWLPTDELTIGLEHFGDATTRKPEPNAPLEIDRYLADLLSDAARFATLTFLAPPVIVGEAMRDGVLGGQLAAEHVFAGGLVGYLRDHPERPPPWRAYIEAGARVYRHEGHIPCNLFVVDETVLIENSQRDGRHTGAVIESQNETVRAWALDLIGGYREAAEPVEADTFA